MSEEILKALMELFAIIASPEGKGNDRRSVVQSFLLRQLNRSLVSDYLKLFDAYNKKHQELQNKRSRKRIGADSVKVLKICNAINKELAYRQKVVVLVHLFEFVKADKNQVSEQEFAFITAVSESFYIPQNEYTLIKNFVLEKTDDHSTDNNILIINGNTAPPNNECKHLYSEHLKGYIKVINVTSANIYFMRYSGGSELYINGQIMQPDKTWVLNAGSSVRNHHVKPIYFSDIISIFSTGGELNNIFLEAKNISYKFRNDQIGIHELDFNSQSGKLVGIMGASGAGKSTLLNILNGSVEPSSGNVFINGIDIHKDKEQVEGLIGYVSQDDLLIEELTVFQNLFYNARLCFDNYSSEKLLEVTYQMLHNLGLYDIKNIQVGSPLNKKISGGQRKRLNIALELIREPAVLFLDEPTSGLSSRDSENIMDLLKDLTLKGKLVFVVIHQPSSDIFKMFDRLLILDTGGYLIYNGNPVDSITYFKSKVHHANWADSECQLCGNVNPEQIFNIVESLVIDEYGTETRTRKTSPEEWHNYYISQPKKEEDVLKENKGILPEISFKIPGLLTQAYIFITRDLISKITNRQYLILTFLEAPILGFILSYIIKYYNVSGTNDAGYVFMENSNLPVYIFMSVIVAIFMGLTVSAEEIIKDRKILKRERFLNLSWSGYLISKVAIMFGVSAIQSLSFVLVGNTILEIKGMFLTYWIILFSAWASANIMGLLISDSFKTVVTIYILIPFLVIPQIVFSGVIIKYEKLNPEISSPGHIPVYGEIMTARWGYEALATEQFINNKYGKAFYPVNKIMSIADYKKNYWIKHLENKIDYLIDQSNTIPLNSEINNIHLDLIRNEIKHELPVLRSIQIENIQTINLVCIDSLTPSLVNEGVLRRTREFLGTVNRIYIKIYNNANDKKDELIRTLQEELGGREQFLTLKRDYHNDKLTEFVQNNNEFVRILEYKGKLYQKIDPVYFDPEHPIIKAHFYAPRKMFFGRYYSTFWVNTLVIWGFSALFFTLLYFRILKKALDYAEQTGKPREL